MDVVTIIYYAIVCGLLGWVAPKLGRPAARMGLGVAVGIAAAALLPTLRAALGV